jgi:hypothetical protein
MRERSCDGGVSEGLAPANPASVVHSLHQSNVAMHRPVPASTPSRHLINRQIRQLREFHGTSFTLLHVTFVGMKCRKTVADVT